MFWIPSHLPYSSKNSMAKKEKILGSSCTVHHLLPPHSPSLTPHPTLHPSSSTALSTPLIQIIIHLTFRPILRPIPRTSLMRRIHSPLPMLLHKLLLRTLRPLLDRLLRRAKLDHHNKQLGIGFLVLERVSERVRSALAPSTDYVSLPRFLHGKNVM